MQVPVIVEAYRMGLLAKNLWLRNLLAGLIVGVVALPLSMAFAIASGVRPEQGLYTAIVASIVVSLFGGSRVQIAGPTGAFIVILAGIVQTHGVEGLQIATLMAGILLVIFGLTRMGALIKFIPEPVIAGFTAGIGVIIFFGQMGDFLGLPKLDGRHFHEKMLSMVDLLPQWQFSSSLVGLVSLLLILYGNRFKPLQKVPAPLLGLLGGTILGLVLQPFGFSFATIGSQFGEMPSRLPAMHLPPFNFGQMIDLTGSAFAIAMLCAIESLLSAVVADGMSGSKHHSNQELIGQGLANMLTPLFGGIAATGAIARTASNIRSGGNSPIAGLVHALTLIGMIVLLAPLASYIPMATLAAILLVVAWNMSDLPHVKSIIKRAPRADIAILIVTFMLTIFADLVVAVNVGVLLATLQFMRRMSSSVQVRENGDDDFVHELKGHGLASLPSNIAVYTLDGPMFFGAADIFERAMRNTANDPKVLIIRMRWVPFIDLTGIQALEETIQHFQKRGVNVFISGANPRVSAKLNKAGVVHLVGEAQYFTHFSEALTEGLLRTQSR